MQIAQRVLQAASSVPVSVRLDGDRAVVAAPDGPAARFRWIELPSLSIENAAAVEAGPADDPLLVFFGRSSAPARQQLRQQGIAYAGADGYWFVSAAGLHVDRDDRLRPPRATEERAFGEAALNPFGIRTSRIARHMLLHAGESFGVKGLAQATALNPASVSRTVRALEAAGLVVVEANANDRRTRSAGLREPAALLGAWLPEWQRRRISRRLWDVGTRDASDTLALLRSMPAGGEPRGWAVGGLAGAALHQRTVEPSDVTVWVRREDVPALADELMPRELRSRRQAGLHLAVLPDPFVLRSAEERDGLPVADPVQLWLDCMTEGERAAEAAAAISEAEGW